VREAEAEAVRVRPGPARPLPRAHRFPPRGAPHLCARNQPAHLRPNAPKGRGDQAARGRRPARGRRACGVRGCFPLPLRTQVPAGATNKQGSDSASPRGGRGAGGLLPSTAAGRGRGGRRHRLTASRLGAQGTSATCACAPTTPQPSPTEQPPSSSGVPRPLSLSRVHASTVPPSSACKHCSSLECMQALFLPRVHASTRNRILPPGTLPPPRSSPPLHRPPASRSARA